MESFVFNTKLESLTLPAFMTVEILTNNLEAYNNFHEESRKARYEEHVKVENIGT